MSGFSDERKNAILYELDNYGNVSVQQLAKTLNVTPETIRRDLDDLESQRKLKRVHGGAVKISYDKLEPSYMLRQSNYAEEKKRIGKLAASLIQDGDTIAIDVGTTTAEIIYHLADKNNITVLLNSVFALNELMDCKIKKLFNGKIIFLGGEINGDQMSCFGPICERVLEQFYVDKAFIAIGGMSLSHGLTGYDIQEANLSKCLMANAKEVIVVSDHSKIGVRNFYQIAPMDAVDMIISDVPEPKEWVEGLVEKGICWITA